MRSFITMLPVALSLAVASATAQNERGPGTSSSSATKERAERPAKKKQAGEGDLGAKERAERSTTKKQTGEGDVGAKERADESAKKKQPTGAAKPDERIRPGRDANEALSPSDSDSKVLRHIAREETKHRKRLATINRLRTLAQEKDQTKRLEALDDLEKRQTELHERKIARWRERLGDERFTAIRGRAGKNGKNASGRGQGANERKGENKSQKANEKKSRGANEKGKSASKGKRGGRS